MHWGLCSSNFTHFSQSSHQHPAHLLAWKSVYPVSAAAFTKLLEVMMPSWLYNWTQLRNNQANRLFTLYFISKDEWLWHLRSAIAQWIVPAHMLMNVWAEKRNKILVISTGSLFKHKLFLQITFAFVEITFNAHFNEICRVLMLLQSAFERLWSQK